MGMLRPIPRSLLDAKAVVYGPAADGGFKEGREIAPVRFERVHEVVDDPHRSDVIRGRVFVDAVMSDGAYEVSAGSRIEIDGVSMMVAAVKRLEGAHGQVHHWELEIR